MTKTIQLPCFGIELHLSGNYGTITSNLKEPCPSRHESEDETSSRAEFNRAIDGIEALILAAACEGIDVTTPAFLAAIEAAVDAAGNNI